VTAATTEKAERLEQKRIAILRRHGQRLQMKPLSSAVMAALQTVVRTVKPRSPGGYKVVSQNTPLFEQETELGEPVLRFGAGLEPVVRRILAGLGIEVHGASVRRAPLPAPMTDALKKLAPIDLPLLECVPRHERGLIRIAANVRPARLIAEIALAWPEKNVTTVVSRRDDAHHLARDLRKLVGKVSVISGQDNPAVVERVIVCTNQGLGHGALYRGEQCKAFDHSWLDIVIALDALEAVGEVPRNCLQACHRARLYGFLDRRAEPTPLEKDRLAELFGFEEVVIPAHGYRERPVEVVFLPFRDRLEPIEPHPLTVKSQAVWGHARRNRKIAALALGLQDNDRAALLKRFPAVEAGIASLPMSPRTIVHAENVPHALGLARHLPGWPVITGPEVPINLLPADEAKLLHTANTCQDKPVHAIVTVAGLVAIDLAAVDIVIRADAGPGLAPLHEDGLVERCNEPPHRLLLVNLDDRHHHLLRRWSRKRLAAYQKRGWHAPGADPVQMRVDRFIASRPGRRRR